MAQHRIAGMDLYIEAQAWRDFHANFIVSLQGALMPLLAPKYFARIEEQIYIDHEAPAHRRSSKVNLSFSEG